MTSEMLPPLAHLKDAVGTRIVGDWSTIDQQRIDAFAAATGDHQWIHVDPERAADGPFGATIAHGYLLLSLIPTLTAGILAVEGAELVINYGLDRVRFVTPVPVGSRVRAISEVAAVEGGDSGVRLAMDVTIEREGSARPAVVARTIALFRPAS